MSSCELLAFSRAEVQNLMSFFVPQRRIFPSQQLGIHTRLQACREDLTADIRALSSLSWSEREIMERQYVILAHFYFLCLFLSFLWLIL
jgi:hypothetical protein